MSRRFLIVNADDLGLSPEVDAGILAGARAGVVTSASLFVNPPHSAELESFLNAGVSLGLHLNLTQGRPCSDRADSLTGPNRGFIPDRDELIRNLDLIEARVELGQQLERFEALTGRRPSHLDFHKHLHAHDERLLRLGIELARELDAPLRAMTPELRRRISDAGARCADHFMGEVRPAPYWTLERLRERLEACPGGVTELMCHPGRDVGPIPGLWYAAERDAELDALLDPAARALFARFQLVSFDHAPIRR